MHCYYSVLLHDLSLIVLHLISIVELELHFYHNIKILYSDLSILRSINYQLPFRVCAYFCEYLLLCISIGSFCHLTLLHNQWKKEPPLISANYLKS